MKKIVMRCLLGAALGVTLSTLITIAISLTLADGTYYAVVPELINDCGSEIAAVSVQFAASLLYGAAWAGASLVWEKENWSILRQTVTHLVICSAATFPIAYLMRWMHHDIGGILLYFGIFFVVYAAIWLAGYNTMKKRVKQMNDRLKSPRNE